MAKRSFGDQWRVLKEYLEQIEQDYRKRRLRPGGWRRPEGDELELILGLMIRRLVETLIIETFEAHGIADRIKNPGGDFFHLADLVNITLAETSWNLGRNTKQALRDLKDVGDKSAHSRRFIAH